MTTLRETLRGHYHGVCAAVRELSDRVVRASSLVENLNSRLRSYFFLRRQLGKDYLTLLQFFLNHRRYLAAVKTRVESARVRADLLTVSSTLIGWSLGGIPGFPGPKALPQQPPALNPLRRGNIRVYARPDVTRKWAFLNRVFFARTAVMATESGGSHRDLLGRIGRSFITPGTFGGDSCVISLQRHEPANFDQPILD